MQSTHYSYQILTKLNFLSTFSNNTQTPNFMIIRLEVAELFHAGRRTDVRTDGRTGRHEKTNSFSQFCEPT